LLYTSQTGQGGLHLAEFDAIPADLDQFIGALRILQLLFDCHRTANPRRFTTQEPAPCASLSRKLLGRMSDQFASM
jgi:hypothetical protein